MKFMIMMNIQRFYFLDPLQEEQKHFKVFLTIWMLSSDGVSQLHFGKILKRSLELQLDFW